MKLYHEEGWTRKNLGKFCLKELHLVQCGREEARSSATRAGKVHWEQHCTEILLEISKQWLVDTDKDEEEDFIFIYVA